jgi:hypothetical protein
MTDRRFECTFCGGGFVYEQRFINHRCKQMIRDEDFKTPIGQAAWLFYQKWMKAHRRHVPKVSAFLHSKFYNSFFKFAEFSKRTKIPDVDVFIWLMKEKDISPTIWTNDQVYVLYLEFVDHKLSPAKHAEITVNTLFDLSNNYGCDIAEVFNNIEPTEVIQLLRQRRLSPWILLHSSKFKQFFINKVSTEAKIIMESIIRPYYWSKKFKECQKDVSRMKLYVAELSL